MVLRQESVADEGAAQASSLLSSRAVAAPISRRLQIVEALRESIVRNEIRPGSQLKQDEIAALFHVSPAPVREALSQLASEGLVEHHPNRGSFVCDISTDELLNIVLPARVLAESYAAVRVASPLRAEVEALLVEQIDVMEAGAADDDLASVIEADVEYHRIIIDACQSYQASQLWQSVLSRARVQLYRLGPRHPSLDDVAVEHRVLLDALRSGDPYVIKKTISEHILDVSAELLGK